MFYPRAANQKVLTYSLAKELGTGPTFCPAAFLKILSVSFVIEGLLEDTRLAKNHRMS
jgi:hypothetical protein